jgi:hypothetical protein
MEWCICLSHIFKTRSTLFQTQEVQAMLMPDLQNGRKRAKEKDYYKNRFNGTRDKPSQRTKAIRVQMDIQIKPANAQGRNHQA